MKKLTLILTAAILSLAFMTANTASGDEFHAKKSAVKLTFEKATSIPGLVQAMYAQIDKDILKSNFEVYVARVKYNGKVYLIYGTYGQWENFLTKKWQYWSEKTTGGVTTR
jgi:hypothetical protein